MRARVYVRADIRMLMPVAAFTDTKKKAKAASDGENDNGGIHDQEKERTAGTKIKVRTKKEPWALSTPHHTPHRPHPPPLPLALSGPPAAAHMTLHSVSGQGHSEQK